MSLLEESWLTPSATLLCKKVTTLAFQCLKDWCPEPFQSSFTGPFFFTWLILATINYWPHLYLSLWILLWLITPKLKFRHGWKSQIFVGCTYKKMIRGRKRADWSTKQWLAPTSNMLHKMILGKMTLILSEM